MPEPSRTFHANQAVMLSDLIRIKFSDRRYGTTTPRQLRITEPDGPSTEGGLKARQSVVLVPEGQESNQNAIVCGWLDVSRRTAELRSYPQISQQHQARYGGAPDLSRGEYERCVQELHEFLRSQAIDSRVSVAPGRKSQPPAPAASRAPGADRGLILSVALLSFVLGFAACWFLVAARVIGSG